MAFRLYVARGAYCLEKRRKGKQKLSKRENKMSEPIELITLCVAGLGALSTLVVALFSPPAKPRVRKSLQSEFNFEEDKSSAEKTKDKLLVSHN